MVDYVDMKGIFNIGFVIVDYLHFQGMFEERNIK